ncbi:metallophosphoesterase [Halobacillus sp. Marseille-Q1614]|uniref:metallophosphoesterase family protein n=1 Tax=Halobacillus sp. Marseille-Q1614 TaxID=2709134 RepID=UPI0015713784|nr:metallophosphoesterase family protein [Halobacillus sp. Marseille-Q1614]
MTKIAVISDIHGNETALQEVLNDVHSRGIKRIFCLGDLIGKGPQGSECIQLIRQNCEKVIRGNWDVFIQNPSPNSFIQWFQDRLTEDDFLYLNSLPFHIDLELNGKLLRFFHASPRSEFERILPHHSLEKRLSMFENSPHTGDTAQPDAVFYGDIHTTLLQTYNQGILCNVGSVGNSLDLTSASYAIVDAEQPNIAIQFIRVPYDRRAELEISRKAGLPELEKYEQEIISAKYRNA